MGQEAVNYCSQGYCVCIVVSDTSYEVWGVSISQATLAKAEPLTEAQLPSHRNCRVMLRGFRCSQRA